MPNLDRLTEQAAERRVQPLKLLRDLRAAGEPISISINGLAHFPIKDDGAYQLLLELLDRLELTEVLRERLDDLNAGRPLLSMEEAKAQVRAKYGLSL